MRYSTALACAFLLVLPAMFRTVDPYSVSLSIPVMSPSGGSSVELAPVQERGAFHLDTRDFFGK